MIRNGPQKLTETKYFSQLEKKQTMQSENVRLKK